MLNANGSAENWVVTASSRSGTSTGRWKVEGKVLTLLFENDEEWSQPFTIYDGQLVFPNVQDRRRYWDKYSQVGSASSEGLLRMLPSPGEHRVLEHRAELLSANRAR